MAEGGENTGRFCCSVCDLGISGEIELLSEEDLAAERGGGLHAN